MQPLNYFSFSPTEVSMAVVLFNIFLATVIAFAIAYVHKYTHTGLSYSQSFFATLILVSIIASVVMMIVQNNVYAALGLLGAFALIRFRTIIKETRDIAFLFFALAEGVAMGLSHYAVGIVSAIIISAVAYAIFRFNLGSTSDKKFVLLLTSKLPIDQVAVNSQLKSEGLNLSMLSSKKRQNDFYEYTFSLSGKNIGSADKIISKFASSLSITEYDLVSGRESIEY